MFSLAPGNTFVMSSFVHSEELKLVEAEAVVMYVHVVLYISAQKTVYCEFLYIVRMYVHTYTYIASSHQKILQEFSPQIRRLLNMSSLLPHLLGRFLLTEEQHQELLLPSVTDIRKADLLPQWLPHSKTNYLEEFVQCLENDDQHQGK